jgi:hypothetical protein
MAFAEKIMSAHVKDIVDSITDLAALNKSEGGIPGLEYIIRLARIQTGLRLVRELPHAEADSLMLLVAASGNRKLDFTLAHFNKLNIKEFSTAAERVQLHEQLLAVGPPPRSPPG